MTRCWICSAPTPLREAAHPESPNGAPRRAASEQRRDRSAVRVLEHCSSSSGTVTIGSRPRVLDAAIGCRYLASITAAAKRADGRRVEPSRHDIRANEMSTRRAIARRCRGRPLAGEGGHDPTRRSRDPRCPEAAANKAINGVELVPASLPRAATGSPARARSQSSETGHAGRRRRASARRRLRSPRDPRRGDRVRHGAIVPAARLAPPPGRKRKRRTTRRDRDPDARISEKHSSAKVAAGRGVIAVPAGRGSTHASTREHASGRVGAGARMRGRTRVRFRPPRSSKQACARGAGWWLSATSSCPEAAAHVADISDFQGVSIRIE